MSEKWPKKCWCSRVRLHGRSVCATLLYVHIGYREYSKNAMYNDLGSCLWYCASKFQWWLTKWSLPCTNITCSSTIPLPSLLSGKLDLLSYFLLHLYLLERKKDVKTSCILFYVLCSLKKMFIHCGYVLCILYKKVLM